MGAGPSSEDTSETRQNVRRDSRGAERVEYVAQAGTSEDHSVDSLSTSTSTSSIRRIQQEMRFRAELRRQEEELKARRYGEAAGTEEFFPYRPSRKSERRRLGGELRRQEDESFNSERCEPAKYQAQGSISYADVQSDNPLERIPQTNTQPWSITPRVTHVFRSTIPFDEEDSPIQHRHYGKAERRLGHREPQSADVPREYPSVPRDELTEDPLEDIEDPPFKRIQGLEQDILKLQELLEKLKEQIGQLEKEGMWRVDLFEKCKDPAYRILLLINVIRKFPSSNETPSSDDPIATRYKQIVEKIHKLVDPMVTSANDFLMALNHHNPVDSVKSYKAICEGVKGLAQIVVTVPSSAEPQCLVTEKAPKQEPTSSKRSSEQDELSMEKIMSMEKITTFKENLLNVVKESRDSVETLNRGRRAGKMKNEERRELVVEVKNMLYQCQFYLRSIRQNLPQDHTTETIRNQVHDTEMNLKQFLNALWKQYLPNLQYFYEQLYKDVEDLDQLMDRYPAVQEVPEPSGNNAIDLCAESNKDVGLKSSLSKDSDIEDIIKTTEVLDLGQPMETLFHSIKPSISVDSNNSFSLQTPDLHIFQETLSRFCNESIDTCKKVFKTLNLNKKDGTEAIVLRHFMKIESDILHFQMRTALIALNNDSSNEENVLENDFFPMDLFGINQKTMDLHQENIKSMLSKIREELKKLERCYTRKTTMKPTLDPSLYLLAVYVLSMYNSNQELIRAGDKKELFTKSFPFKTLTWMFQLLYTMEIQETLSKNYRILFEECIEQTKKRFDQMDLS